MPITRNSKQRTAIMSELSSRTDHPTAEELYLTLKTNYPTLSLGTVYRNLKQLYEEGMVLCLNCDSSDRFDDTVTPHFHLSCTNCKRLYDLEIPEIPNIIETAEKHYKGRIDTYSLIYTGVCEECMKKINN